MYDFAFALELALRIANLFVAIYLLLVVFSIRKAGKGGSFSKTLRTMLVAVLLFFAVEIAQLFRLIPGEAFGTIQSFFALVFLLLLLSAMHEVKKGMLAHDHLVKHKGRQKIVDVE